MSEYVKTEICGSIIAARRNHCHVPADVWELDAATVCGVCQAKNALLVTALLQSVDIESQEVVVRASVVKIDAQLCTKCSRSHVGAERWNVGLTICSYCQCEVDRAADRAAKRAMIRTCRFCGRTNLTAQGFRDKHQACTQVACLVSLWDELKKKKSEAAS